MLRGILLLCAILLGSCGSEAQQPSPFIAQQAQPASPKTRNRLFYIGLALYSESWSANDVTELADELEQTTDFDVVPLIASNLTNNHARYPIADNATIASMARTVAERMGPNDVVLVHVSSHGEYGVLASKIGNHQTTALMGSTLASLLAPLGSHRTIIIVSACYSGSLIGNLRSPTRIIITAARADRSSFGCASGNRHTFFGEAELAGFGERDRSLHQVFTAMRANVAQMEQEDDFKPSEPQVSVGANVRDLYDAPLF